MMIGLFTILFYSGCLQSQMSIQPKHNKQDNKLEIGTLIFDVISKQESTKSQRTARITRIYTKYILNSNICREVIHSYNKASGRSYFRASSFDEYEKCDLKKIDNIRFYTCGHNYTILEGNAGRNSRNVFNLLNIYDEKCFDAIYENFKLKETE